MTEPKTGLNAPLHEDFRGKIIRNNIEGTKFNTLFTKAGMYRGGDYHSIPQLNLFLSGEVEVTIRDGNKDVVTIKKANEFLRIPPNTPHVFKALTDSVMLEWWDGPFDGKYYNLYRKFVNEQFKKP